MFNMNDNLPIPARKKSRSMFAVSFGKPRKVSSGTPPKMAIPADRTQPYYDRALVAAGAAAPQAKNATARDASAYITGMDAALGIKAPIDTRKTIKAAALSELDRAAHEQDVAEAGRLQQQGAAGSPLSLALQGRRGATLAGQRAQTVADIEQDFANRQDTYNQQRRAAAIGAGSEMTSTSRFNAGQSADRNRLLSATNADLGRQIGQQDIDRATLDYEVNQLFPFQVKQSDKMAQLAMEEARRQARINAILGGLDAATNVGAAYVGGL